MLGIVLINYKNSKEVSKYIIEELSKISIQYTVAIVDNSCDNNEFEALKQIVENRENYYLINANDNLGYAKANNLGAQYLLDIEPIDYLLFSNTDIVLTDDDIVTSLIEQLENDSEIVCIGPKVITPNKKQQNPNRNVSFFDRYIMSQLLYPIKFIRYNKSKILVPNAKSGNYDWLSGSFFMIDANVFSEIGMFDSHTFLFAEEMILGERLRAKDYNCYFYNEKSILHIGSTTILNYFSLKTKALMIYKSEWYFYNTYKNVPNFMYYIGLFSHEVYYRIFMKFILFKIGVNSTLYLNHKYKCF